MYNIVPIQNANYDCFEASLISLANYWNRNYVFMFADSWRFNYDCKKVLFGERIRSNCNRKTEKLLFDYHGIGCEWVDSPEINVVYTVIKGEFQKNIPCVVVMDTYWCPWLGFYKKYHSNHYCIILHIDNETKNLICLDPYYSLKQEVLTYDDLQNGCKKLLTINLSHAKALEDINCKSLLKEYGLSCINNCDFHKMRNFAYDISKYLNLKDETKGFDEIQAVPLFIELKLLEAGRVNFSSLVSFIKEHFNMKELENYSYRLSNIATLWSKLRLLMIKSLVSRQDLNNNERISEKILTIADIEEELAKEINSLISSI